MKLAVMIAAAFAAGAVGGTLMSPARRAAPVEVDAATADSGHATAESPDAELAVHPDAPVPGMAKSDLSPDSLREVLSHLTASEAATRLAQMDDHEAVSVLRTMSVPEATRLLVEMDSARAGVLSALMLTASAGT